jgi:hypothetical protein
MFMQVLPIYQALPVPTSNPKSPGFILKMSPFFFDYECSCMYYQVTKW